MHALKSASNQNIELDFITFPTATLTTTAPTLISMTRDVPSPEKQFYGELIWLGRKYQELTTWEDRLFKDIRSWILNIL